MIFFFGDSRKRCNFAPKSEKVPLVASETTIESVLILRTTRYDLLLKDGKILILQSTTEHSLTSSGGARLI